MRVISGAVFDDAVDIRKSSPTFCTWVGEILSTENKPQICIPEGFAHGFLVLSDTVEFLYKTRDYCAPEYERSIIWNDPELAIAWPLHGELVLARKDAEGKRINGADLF